MKFNSDNIRIYNYRPFFKQYIYYDKSMVESMYNQMKIFPHESAINHAIITATAQKEFSCFCVKNIHDYYYILNGQTFPILSHPAKNESVISNINREIKERVNKKYKTQAIDDKIIFSYVYGILHSTEYRNKFQTELAKGIPKIPLVTTKEDFMAFSYHGQRLINMHVDYENAPEYSPLDITITQEDYKVKKMKWLNSKKTQLKFNASITFDNIPEICHNYTINGKSCLWWFMNKYQVKIDKNTGIINDPNQFSKDSQYIFKLLKKLIYISLKTQSIQQEMPKLAINKN